MHFSIRNWFWSITSDFPIILDRQITVFTIQQPLVPFVSTLLSCSMRCMYSQFLNSAHTREVNDLGTKRSAFSGGTGVKATETASATPGLSLRIVFLWHFSLYLILLVMAFIGKKTVGFKVVSNDQLLEQVAHFRCFGRSISYICDNGTKRMLQAFQVMCSTVNRTLKNKTRKRSKLKCYEIMDTPACLLGCEVRVTIQRVKNKIREAEIKFKWKVKGCSRMDKHRSEGIRKDLQIFSLNNSILEYKHKWFQRVQRTDGTPWKGNCIPP
jgi:hypothetical protein